VPAAQREIAIGEVRFTLPVGGTITIAANVGDIVRGIANRMSGGVPKSVDTCGQSK
jgi:hypothetical protein